MKDYKKILEGIVNIINTTEKSDIGFANICSYIGENCPELKEQAQKSTVWSEEDKNMLENTIGLIEVLDRETKGAYTTKKYINFLKSLKDRVQPKQVLRDTFGYEDGRQFGKNEVLGNPEKYGLQRFAEWSKSDKDIVKEIDTIIHGTNSISDEVRKKLQDWLKSLRPHNRWKPSDEQMDALLYVVRNYTPGVTERIAWESIKTLELMFKDLKKLKGEQL